jgi:hypothetical protein
MQLLFKELTRQGVPTATMLMWVFALGALQYVLHVRTTGLSIAAAPWAFALMAVTALLSYVGNLYSVRAVAAAPNPGYAVAIVGLQAGVVTVASVALFGVAVTWIKGLGVVLCALGVALLVI